MNADFGITDELVEFVKHQEGWVPHTYICPAGHPTQGWGRRVPSLDLPPIDKATGEQWLREDLRTARDAALRLSPSLADASERRVAAIVDFCFNCGSGNYRDSTLRKKVDAQDWPGAAVEMRRWVHAAGKVFQPLVARRNTTAGWLEQG